MEKKVYGFFTDFLRGEGEQAYGLLTDSYRIWKRKFTDFLRILTGFGREAYGFFTGLRRAGLRIAYGFLPDLGEEAYGFFTG